MNTVLVLLMLILVLFALKEGMVWIALAVGAFMVIMVSLDSSDSSAPAENKKMFYESPQLPPVAGTKEQMLRVKYEPNWDGNSWWEEMADHWGQGAGRMIGMFR
jgi:hypothetical protein